MRIEIYDSGDWSVGIPSAEAKIEIISSFKYSDDDVTTLKDFFREFFDLPRADIIVTRDDIIECE